MLKRGTLARAGVRNFCYWTPSFRIHYTALGENRRFISVLGSFPGNLPELSWYHQPVNAKEEGHSIQHSGSAGRILISMSSKEEFGKKTMDVAHCVAGEEELIHPESKSPRRSRRRGNYGGEGGKSWECGVSRGPGQSSGMST